MRKKEKAQKQEKSQETAQAMAQAPAEQETAQTSEQETAHTEQAQAMAQTPETEQTPPAEPSLELPSLEQLADELEREQYKKNYRRVLRSTVVALVAVAAVSVLIAVLLLPILQITGTSMTDTLQDGDIVVAFSGKSYKQGDVIAFYYNNEILVKRVIATAGDWVNIDEDGNVYVNDQLLDEPYVSDKAFGQCNIELPYQVPDGRCFIMGDHRSTSIDSRNTAVGCISNDMIVGRILFRIWPFESFSWIH